MRRYALPAAITAVVVAFLSVLVVGLSASTNNTAVESQVQSGHTPTAPDAHLVMQLIGNGDRQELANYRGHYVMVNFFAGWCDACQADAGSVALAQKLLARVGGRVLGVTYQDSSTDALNYMRTYHLNFPVLHDGSGEFASAYGVDGVPETFIVNPQGKVVADRTYQLTNGWVTHTLKRVLGEPGTGT